MGALKKEIRGHGVAMITPFDKTLQVDYNSISKNTNNLLKGNVDFLVLLGTTSESATLKKEEKKKIIDHVVSVNSNEVPLVLGLGSNNTQEVLDDLRFYNLEPFSALLSITPYYNKPSQKGLYEHFKAITLSSPLPIILYNVPGRTSINMTPDTVIRLAEDFKKIIGVKEASNNLGQAKEILEKCSKDFIVLSGDDHLAVPMILSGAKGLISVTGNAIPKKCTSMVHYALENNVIKATSYQDEISKLIGMIFSEGNPTGIKALMNILGLCENQLRLPLVSASNELIDELKKEIILHKNLY
jgi:4-hydroxy-tetrahydrodipicolinate synthase